jgi:acyl dehydratase
MSDDNRIPMKAENLHEGLKLGPLFYVVSAEQVRKFRAALKDAGAGEDQAIAPPTMRLNDYALLIASRFKGGKGGVHAKHWCEFHEPLRAGQSIRVDGTVTATFRKRGKFYFTLEYEQRDAESGALMMRQAITSVLLNEKGEMK